MVLSRADITHIDGSAYHEFVHEAGFQISSAVEQDKVEPYDTKLN